MKTSIRLEIPESVKSLLVLFGLIGFFIGFLVGSFSLIHDVTGTMPIIPTPIPIAIATLLFVGGFVGFFIFIHSFFDFENDWE